MSRNILAPLLLLSLAAAFLTGCAAPDHLAAWQQTVERYIELEGNGDANALRYLQGMPARSEIGCIGASSGGMPLIGSHRTDAQGILLGRRSVAQRDWYLFLVGIVAYRGVMDASFHNPRLRDLRLAALSADDGAYTWAVSPEEPAALEQYLRSQLEDWQRSHPEEAPPADLDSTFPRPHDRVTLLIDDRTATATEERSQARWTLDLASAAPTER